MQRTIINIEQDLFDIHYQEYKKKYGIDLGFLLEAVCSDNPGNIFYQEQKVSLEILQKKVWTLQKILLLEHKIKKNDHVALFIQNSTAFYGAYYAVLACGAVVVPINTFLSDAELLSIIQDAAPVLIITLDEEKERIMKLKNSFSFCGVFAINDSLENISETHEKQEVIRRDEDACAVILYTSGTTGKPKGVMLSCRNIITNMLQTYARFFAGTKKRKHTIVAALPLFHSFTQITCVITAVYVGADIIILPKLDRHSLTESFTHYKPTIFLGVPALYGLLCMLKKINLDSVEFFICGGDALPNKIRQVFALLYNRKICNGYGLSESSPVVAANLDDVIAENGNTGKPLVGISVKIRDEEEKEVAKGEIGNLYVHGNNVMRGYYNEEEQTKKVLHDGWLNTGDRAYINKNDEIVIVGREKDLIVHKGIKIYPQEIEQVILMHPAVIRVAVVGKKEKEMSEEFPIAYIQIRSEFEKNPEKIKQEIMQLCKDQLAQYKLPRSIEILKDVPLTVTGKIDKKKLK